MEVMEETTNQWWFHIRQVTAKLKVIAEANVGTTGFVLTMETYGESVLAVKGNEQWKAMYWWSRIERERENDQISNTTLICLDSKEAYPFKYHSEEEERFCLAVIA